MRPTSPRLSSPTPSVAAALRDLSPFGFGSPVSVRLRPTYFVSVVASFNFAPAAASAAYAKRAQRGTNVNGKGGGCERSFFPQEFRFASLVRPFARRVCLFAWEEKRREKGI